HRVEDVLDGERSRPGVDHRSRLDVPPPGRAQVPLQLLLHELALRAEDDLQVDAARHLQPGVGRRDQHVGRDSEHITGQYLDLHGSPPGGCRSLPSNATLPPRSATTDVWREAAELPRGYPTPRGPPTRQPETHRTAGSAR